MTSDAFIHCRVSSATKAALSAAAERQQLTESALVKRLLELMLHTVPVVASEIPSDEARPTRLSRLYVRLAAKDWALLRQRSMARNMAPAAYASCLLRAHLQDLPRLPEAELGAVKEAARELRQIGSNINQIAKVAHQTGRVTGPGRDDLRAFLKVCVGLRDHIEGLLKENAQSWRAADG